MLQRTQPKVSIIIPSWFKEKQDGRYGKNEVFFIAQECLKRLIKVTPKVLYELIIIDNGSTLDLDVENVPKRIINNWLTPELYFAEADILIRNKINLGFAKAVNQGFRVARGKYFMQMNNDVLLYDGWLETMIEDFENFEDLEKESTPPIGLLMPAITKDKMPIEDRLKVKKEDLQMDNKGLFGVKAEFGSLYMGCRDFLQQIVDKRGKNELLDENFKIGYGEDRWLYREVRMLGKETWRTHNLRVTHFGGLSMSKIKNEGNNRELIDNNRIYLEELKKKHNIE